MSKDDGASILDELDSRLDDFFADDDDFLEDESSAELSQDTDSGSEPDGIVSETIPEKVQSVVEKEETKSKMPGATANVLDSLKAVVLEMDWEINDENLSNYLNEINRLIVIYKDDRPLYLFLKLHNSIGRYMLSKKATAHPEALKFLYTVFNSLEKATSSTLSIAEKHRMILTEVRNFKNLKAKLFPDKYKFVEDVIPKKSISEDQPAVKDAAAEVVTPDDRQSSKPDLSDLPDDVQNEINKYIEGAIASKIEQLKKQIK